MKSLVDSWNPRCRKVGLPFPRARRGRAAPPRPLLPRRADAILPRNYMQSIVYLDSRRHGEYRYARREGGRRSGGGWSGVRDRTTWLCRPLPLVHSRELVRPSFLSFYQVIIFSILHFRILELIDWGKLL